MDVERIQSGQTLVAAVKVVSQGKIATPAKLLNSAGAATGGDLLDLGGAIDSEYVKKVLNDSLADRLDKAFADAGVDINTKQLLESGLDTSPEATAKRIVAFSTGFFAAFKNNNKNAGDTEGVDRFAALVKDAVKKGFEDAGQILSGIGQISPEVQGGIDKTHALVTKGLDDFADQQKQSLVAQQKAGAAKKGDLVGVI